MGNSSGVQTKTTQEIFRDYQLMGVEDNPRFGDVSMYKNKSTGEVIWAKEIMLEDRNAEGSLEEYLASNQWQDKLFITKEVFKVGPKDALFCTSNCSSSSKLVVIMEYVDRDLESEVIQRSMEHEKDYFPEPEIWYIIESIMNIEAVVLRQNRFHGDLKTANIFITDDGQTKYFDPCLLDHQTNSYFKVMMNRARCNLPPEYLASLHARQKEPKSNPELADIFALGIIILVLATLREDNYFYDWNRNEIVWPNVKDALEQLKNRYSYLLYGLASGCLKEKSVDRVHISDVLNFIERRKAIKDGE